MFQAERPDLFAAELAESRDYQLVLARFGLCQVVGDQLLARVEHVAEVVLTLSMGPPLTVVPVPRIRLSLDPAGGQGVIGEDVLEPVLAPPFGQVAVDVDQVDTWLVVHLSSFLYLTSSSRRVLILYNQNNISTT